MEAVPHLLTRRRVVVTLVVLAVAGIVGGYGVATRTRPAPTRVELADPAATDSGGGVFVHVAGAVVTPGLYEVDAGSRVHDALAAAGGATPDGNLDALNLASKVQDGDKILVPVKGSAPSGAGPPDGAGAPASGGLVNLNTATAADLDTLPGVGPAIAQRIIDHREEHGGFRTVDELMDVPGIGPAKFGELKDQVTV